jgi:hypothetical protein
MTVAACSTSAFTPQKSPKPVPTFSRDDEGRDFLRLVADQDEPLAKGIEDAWWATTPRPFLVPQQSEETILIALGSANRPLSASAIRLQKLLEARPSVD